MDLLLYSYSSKSHINTYSPCLPSGHFLLSLRCYIIASVWNELEIQVRLKLAEVSITAYTSGHRKPGEAKHSMR